MEKAKVIAIIQAHMGSSRLPGKVMKDLCGMPALYRMIERVRHCKNVDDIVVATSVESGDDILIDACKEWGVSTFRGSDHDVLERFWGATQAYPADAYVRLTSDCPIFDYEYLDEKIQFFWDHNYRYVNMDPNGINGCVNGEVFTAELMKENYENASEGYEHEHVTPYMYTKQSSVGIVPYKMDGRKYRFDMDTPEDYEFIKAVYEALYRPGNDFTVEQVIEFIDAHPEIFALNAEIKGRDYTHYAYSDDKA